MTTTTKAAHTPTPGPWTAVHNDHYWAIQSEAHGQIGDACASEHIYVDGKLLPNEQRKQIATANARLIAAAPMMLEALREAHAVLAVAEASGDEGVADTLAIIRAAIDRATGDGA